ncbi:MAG: hypothetical protein H6727_04545 [Myxococcales bacterium]|nr:hypothetical protein [Myxococcales bacterium]
MTLLAGQHAIVIPFAGRERWDRKLRWMEKALSLYPTWSLVLVGLNKEAFEKIQHRLGEAYFLRVHGVLWEEKPFRVRSVEMNEAVRQGILWGFAEGAQAACTWEAEGEVYPEDVEGMFALLHKSEGVDHVMAARLRLLGREIERSLVRLYYERIFATGISLAIDLSVYDTLCFSQVYLPSHSVIETLSRPFSCALLWQAEFLLRRKMKQAKSPISGQRTLEYPLRHWENHGYSGMWLRHATQVLWEIAVLAKIYRLRGDS